jgi:hypothetical protein
MALESFFYQGDVPTAETLLEAAIEALVACEARNHLDADLCRPMVDGLVKAWCAAREHEASRGDNEAEDGYEERLFDSANEAERAYHQAFTRHYRAVVERAYPKYDASDDGVGWWPDGMNHRNGWPVAFVEALAKTLGAIDGGQAVAMWRYMEEKRAAQRGKAQ